MLLVQNHDGDGAVVHMDGMGVPVFFRSYDCSLITQ